MINGNSSTTFSMLLVQSGETEAETPGPREAWRQEIACRSAEYDAGMAEYSGLGGRPGSMAVTAWQEWLGYDSSVRRKLILRKLWPVTNRLVRKWLAVSRPVVLSLSDDS